MRERPCQDTSIAWIIPTRLDPPSSLPEALTQSLRNSISLALRPLLNMGIIASPSTDQDRGVSFASNLFPIVPTGRLLSVLLLSMHSAAQTLSPPISHSRAYGCAA